MTMFSMDKLYLDLREGGTGKKKKKIQFYLPVVSEKKNYGQL